MRRESGFQKQVLDKIRKIFPGCIVLKNDSSYLQGIPDFVVFWGGQYAMLEFKSSERAPVQPNQAFYVAMFDDWAFAAFVYPENEQQVLDDLQHAFRARR